MIRRNSHAAKFLLGAACGAAALCAAQGSRAAAAYTPIVPTMGDQTVTLDGHNLTIDQIVMVARHGAKVELSAEARRQEAETMDCCSRPPPKGYPCTGSIAAPVISARRSCSKAIR